MGQDPLLNASNKEKTNAQTQIEEDIHDYQIDGKNNRHPEIYDCAQTSSEHKQINPIKLERPKEAIRTEQNSLDNTSDNERNNPQIGEDNINNQEDDENSSNAGITDPYLITDTEPESPKETTTTGCLDNTSDNERNNPQIGEDNINNQEDDENSSNAGITDPYLITDTEPESPKETITTGCSDNTSDNERNNALQNVQSKTEEYTINNQEGYKLELRNSHPQIEGDIINQEQPEITDPVNAYQNPESMSQSILSFLQRKYLELKRPIFEVRKKIFSREIEKKIVKKNNKKNLERSFVDVRKDADISLQIRKFMELERSFVDEYKDAAMSFVDEYINAAIVVSPDVGTKIENRKYKFIKPINCMTDFHASSVPEKDILELESLCSPAKVSMKLNAKSSMNSDPDTRIKMLRLVFEHVKNMWLVDVRKDADMHNLEPLKNMYNRITDDLVRHIKGTFEQTMHIKGTFEQTISYYAYMKTTNEMSNKTIGPVTLIKTNKRTLLDMFGNPDAIVVIKLSKFSKTYELKTQLKAFVQDAVRTSKPVTIEMLRSAASLAGLEIEELFLRNSNNQSITTENLTYVIYFPDDCRYFIFIPAVRDCDSKLKNKTAVVAEQQRQLKN